MAFWLGTVSSIQLMRTRHTNVASESLYWHVSPMTCQSQEPSVVQWTSNIISSIELKIAIRERDRIVDVDCTCIYCSCSASHYKKFYSQSWAAGIQRPPGTELAQPGAAEVSTELEDFNQASSSHPFITKTCKLDFAIAPYFLADSGSNCIAFLAPLDHEVEEWFI